VGGFGLDSRGSGQGQMMGFCEHCDEPLRSMKRREFIAYLRDYYLLNKYTLRHGVSY
jgi:hypothetical protein